MDISIEDKIELLFKENKELKERLSNIKDKNEELEEILDKVKDNLNVEFIEQEFNELFNERFNEIEMKNEKLDDYLQEIKNYSDKNLKKIHIEIENVKEKTNEELLIIKNSIMNIDNIIVSIFDYIEIEKKKNHKNNLINVIGFIGILSIIYYKFA
jgi:hypothetical protein